MDTLGDPLVPVKSSRVPGPFDPLPRWLTKSLLKSGEFEKFGELEYKLLAYLSCVRQKNPFITGWTTYEDMAEVVGACWRRTKQAAMTLAAIGAIRIESKKRQTRFRLIFQDPRSHGDDQTALPRGAGVAAKGISYLGRKTNQRPQQIDVPLDASVEGHSPSGLSANSSHNPAQIVTQPCPKKQASLDEDGEPCPDWVDEKEPSGQSGYVPGADA